MTIFAEHYWPYIPLLHYQGVIMTWSGWTLAMNFDVTHEIFIVK